MCDLVAEDSLLDAVGVFFGVEFGAVNPENYQAIAVFSF
jgi:hypothetical protein